MPLLDTVAHRPDRRSRRRTSHGLVLLCALAVSLPVAAHAAVPGDFGAADVDHDNRVTLPEFETYVRGRLMAANGPRAQAFKAMSPEEQESRLKVRFTMLDRGGKGYLDRGDWNA